ncbi:MAG TPA: S8 family serine peptidase, partial [Pyrinomonadaceae bacterium]
MLICSVMLTLPRAARTREYDSTRASKISPDLWAQTSNTREGNERLGLIIQAQGASSARLEEFVAREKGRVLRRFKRFQAMAVELPKTAVRALAELPEVRYISPNRKVRSFGHVSLTSGAEAVRSQVNSSNVGYTLDGTGIGIAILDSSISSSHDSLGDASGNTRVVANVDFTGQGIPTDDPLGHGTHVAGLAAGNASIASGAYTGIATNAHLINLRVLDSQGLGTTAGFLDAFEWIMDNHQQYNIRVVNVSLGATAVDSYRNDPLCLAVRDAVDAGIIVVTAAGNEGKNNNGQKVYGRIHSPGIEPSAITVGATNTFNTD